MQIYKDILNSSKKTLFYTIGLHQSLKQNTIVHKRTMNHLLSTFLFHQVYMNEKQWISFGFIFPYINTVCITSVRRLILYLKRGETLTYTIGKTLTCTIGETLTPFEVVSELNLK